MLIYPSLGIKRVPEKDEWRLYNCSYYSYFNRLIDEIISGRCPFCVVDREVNKVFHENTHWMVWENTIAPRPESQHQLIFVPREHAESLLDLRSGTLASFWGFYFETLQTEYCRNNNITDDGSLLVRTGNAAMNAKSVPHIHFNFHVPSGKAKAEVTIGKSMDDINAKAPLIKLWVKMREIEASLAADNLPTPPNWQLLLTPEEWILTENKLAPKKAA